LATAAQRKGMGSRYDHLTKDELLRLLEALQRPLCGRR